MTSVFPYPALTRLVLGPPGAVRHGVKRLLIALPAYLFGIAILFAAVDMGRIQVGPALVMAAYAVVGWSGFYLLLRGGFTAQRQEVTLAFPQVLFTLGAFGLCYALIEPSRGLALQWMSLIVVYDMRRLSARQVQVATFGSMGLLIAALLISRHFNLAPVDLETEAINLAAAAMTMPALIIITSIGRRLHHLRQAQRAALHEALAQLNALAIRDGLTQLFNRRHMLALLEEEDRRQKRTGQPFCIALLDLDFFKCINDEHGHPVGDTVLREFSMLAQATWEDGAVMARWGGEEFLVLFCDATPTLALQALDRLRDALAKHAWSAHAQGLAVTFSAGVCEHTAGTDLTQTLERADAALYRAKAQGRNRAIAS
ncbi:MAG: diguanylate cyclase [Burkholderiales bacterium]|nr:diguanylate cyclase [Burkholderiales bacterium]